MFPPRPTSLLHTLLSEVIQAGDLVVDATAGNGHDTVYLAEAVGEEGKVIAMDIQEEAIRSTRSQLALKGLEERVELHQMSHAELGRVVAAGSASAIIFNLGYLPGADHVVITESETTLHALEASVTALQAGGVLAVICYPGHAGGDVESDKVEDFMSQLEGFRLAKYQMLFTQRASPYLLVACKRFNL